MSVRASAECAEGGCSVTTTWTLVCLLCFGGGLCRWARTRFRAQAAVLRRLKFLRPLSTHLPEYMKAGNDEGAVAAAAPGVDELAGR